MKGLLAARRLALGLVLGLGWGISYGQPARLTTIQKQAEALTNLHSEAAKAKGNQQVEAPFFAAFPSSFLQLVALYGFDDSGDSTVYSPLYSSADHIKFFNSLTTVPERDYFEKYVHVVQNGYWQAGNISAFQHGLNMKVLSNVKGFTEVLQAKKDKEIRSFFRFLFDGPQPNNPIARLNYDKMFSKMERLNPELAGVLREEYNALVLETGSSAAN